MKTILSQLLISAALVLLPAAAQAHAVLTRSMPAANAAVHAGALQVDLHYNSRIDAQHCVLSLVGPGGAVTLATHGGAAGNELLATTAALPPGAYTLRWQVLATDGHITRGAIPFHVVR